MPLPDDPVLSAWASALNDAGYWANVLDAEWRYVFQTDELRRTIVGHGLGVGGLMVGSHYFSREASELLAPTVGGPFAEREHLRAWFLELGPYALASMSGGRDELRRVVNPELADLIEDLQPRDAPDAWIVRPEWTTAGADVAGLGGVVSYR